MSQTTEKIKIKSLPKFIVVLVLFLLSASGLAINSFTQRQPPAQTPIGVINGKTIYADEVINQINNDSPFMPALEDDKLNNEPSSSPAPNATPIATPVPRPPAPSFDKQIGNVMKTAKDWLFASVLNTVVKPMLP